MLAGIQALTASLAPLLGLKRPPSPAAIVIDVEDVGSEVFSTEVMVAEPLPASSYLPYMTIAVPVRKQ